MMTASVAEGRAVNTDFFFLHFGKDFYMLCHSIIVGKLEIWTEQTVYVNYVESWLDSQTQGAVGNCEQV